MTLIHVMTPGVLSFLDLLEHRPSHFSPERASAIRTALAVKYE